MRQVNGQASDWTDAQAYAPLLAAERSILAWEWLRRDGRYRAAADRHLAGEDCGVPPDHWGLHRYEPWRLAAPCARPVWRAAAFPAVIAAAATPGARPEDRFDLGALGSLATLVVGAGGAEHLLLSDGLRTIRIDLVRGSFRSGPVELRYRLSGIASAARPLASVQRLLAFHRRGAFATAPDRPRGRARRDVLLLRTHDALMTGATHRDIAGALLGATARVPRWRIETPSLRSAAQRLARSARDIADDGYRTLLTS